MGTVCHAVRMPVMHKIAVKQELVNKLELPVMREIAIKLETAVMRKMAFV